VLNYSKYQTGLYQLKQSGIFEIREDPVITKVPNTNTVNIAVRGVEANKNELLFGGGYGGVNGFFVSGSFRTYNFLGMGTTFAVNADVGKYQQLFAVNYTDPWLFGHRIGGTINIFNRKLKYTQFDQKAIGGSVSVSFPIGLFGYWQVGYTHERSDVSNVQSQVYVNPTYYSSLNNKITSAITAGIGFNTVNNPFRPTRGISANLSVLYAGTWLGGQTQYYKPTAVASLFLPTFKKQNLAFRLQGGYLAAYGGQTIPIWERYFLGGEDSLRGFGVRTVYPEVPVESKGGTTYYRYFLDPQTGTIEGGNRYYLLNMEYVFHVVEQVDVAVFADVGNTYHERQKFELNNYRADAGVEVRFFIPTFNVPLRLIWANNIHSRPNDDFSNFQFSIGLTF